MKEISVTVDITQKDIDQGTRGACGKCPIALALLRTIGYGSKVHVGSLRMAVNTRGHLYLCDAPGQVYYFIDRFDGGHKVNPLLLSINFKPIAAGQLDQYKDRSWFKELTNGH